MKYFMGIDNGLNGGIVVLDENQNIVKKYIIPIIKIGNKNEFDIQKINKIFKDIDAKCEAEENIVYTCLEHAHVRPISGKRACFTTGFCFGLMQGILEALNISYEIVNPKIWQKEIFQGSVSDTKQASIVFCQRKWTNEKWSATERSKKAHDGMTDAACMALYCYRQNR